MNRKTSPTKAASLISGRLKPKTSNRKSNRNAPCRQVHTPKAKSRTQQKVLGPERKLIKKIVFDEVDFHPVRKEELVRKTCFLQKVHSPKAKSRTQHTVLGPERRLIKKNVFQQVGFHPVGKKSLTGRRASYRKSILQKTNHDPSRQSWGQKGDLLRNLYPSR
jgi:hypothetical protein